MICWGCKADTDRILNGWLKRWDTDGGTRVEGAAVCRQCARRGRTLVLPSGDILYLDGVPA